jgi:hypothetical protein
MYKIKRNTIEYLRETDDELCLRRYEKEGVHRHLFVIVEIIKIYGDLKISNK